MRTTVLLALLALAGAFAVSVVTGMLSQEAQTRLARLPVALLRIARILIPGEQRDEWYRELSAELSYIAKETDGLPVTRLLKGLTFAAGAIRGALAIRRSSDARQQSLAPRNPPGRGRATVWQIWVGQYAGNAILIAVSLAAAQGLTFVPDRWLWLLGWLPITIGGRNLVSTIRAHHCGEHGSPAAVTGLAGVMAVIIANGADNIAIYALAFRLSSGSVGSTALTIAVFAVLTAVWCMAGAWLVSRHRVAKIIERRGHWIASAGFIMIGVYVFYKTAVLGAAGPSHLASGTLVGSVFATAVSAAALFAGTNVDAIPVLAVLNASFHAGRRSAR
jgi:cadmium resistance protein CadD (predicted permease)